MGIEEGNGLHSVPNKGIVVWHPGSFELKFGLSQENTVQITTVPHLIARRKQSVPINQVKESISCVHRKTICILIGL